MYSLIPSGFLPYNSYMNQSRIAHEMLRQVYCKAFSRGVPFRQKLDYKIEPRKKLGYLELRFRQT